MSADLRDGDVVASTGAGVHRFGDYLDDGRGGRWFWLVASASQLLLFAGLPPALVLGVWQRSDLDRADPGRIGVVAAVTLVSWSCALVWQGSVRAMWTHRSLPRRAERADDDG